VSGAADFDADYAKAFGTTVAEEDDSSDGVSEPSNFACSGVGLPLVAGLMLMGLMLVKFDE
jgi:hypothetical protein